MLNLHNFMLIMLDNSSYHEVFDNDVPNLWTMKKSELEELLDVKGIVYPANKLSLQLQTSYRN